MYVSYVIKLFGLRGAHFCMNTCGNFFLCMTFLGHFSENGEFSKKGTTNTFFEISTVQKVSNMIVEYSKIIIVPFGCKYNENQQMLENWYFLILVIQN